jgi:hypothetical protein
LKMMISGGRFTFLFDENGKFFEDSNATPPATG